VKRRKRRSGRRTRLLRQYKPIECGKDGYPFVWHHESGVTPSDNRITTRELDPGTLVEVLPAIKDYIRELAGHRCQRCGHPYRSGDERISPGGEWSPCDEHCGPHGGPYRWIVDGEFVQQDDGSFGPTHREAQWRILTVHHLDEDKLNCRWWNLAALCQRCHLRMQRAVVMGRPYHFEHSEWFKLHAAGFYAWKYLGEDLTRAETEARLDELLALEHRFTQEALL
jgi:hypothetical protein